MAHLWLAIVNAQTDLPLIFYLLLKHNDQSNKVCYDFHSQRQCILKLFLQLTLLLHHRFSIGTLHQHLPTHLLTFSAEK